MEHEFRALRPGNPLLKPLVRLLALALPKRLFRSLRPVINLCRYDFHSPLITRDHRPKWIGDGYAGTCKHCGRTIFTMTVAQKRQWRNDRADFVRH